MKFIWQVEDFTTESRLKSEFYPYGAVVGRPRSDDRYLIGYANGTGQNPVLISLQDGAIFANKDSHEAMVQFLNEREYYPLVQRVKI